MDNIIFLILRRMRQPLLALICVYAIAILGLVLIPGQDPDGNVWSMSFFHAFYFVSYMSTTIGFGELPYPFTDGQRLWVTLVMYSTVIVWIYALGAILALLQDKTFQQAIVETRFARRIRHMREEFYLVCGYGETGSELVYALTSRGQHAVVLDIDESRISLIQLQNLPDVVPALCADARRPIHLLEAGLEHAKCAGVVALTDSNEANLKIAIAAKLLHPNIKVICRADSHDIEANMDSFGTDYIIDPYDTFALNLATALQNPCLYLLQRWLTRLESEVLSDPIYPPKNGKWIICGYGRFGKAIQARLKSEGIETTIIEKDEDLTKKAGDGAVLGRGTEASTLQLAGIKEAKGIVAGTDNDANNLSIIMTARLENPDLFVIARQNHADNQAIIDAVDADMVMNPGSIIADKIRVLLATPLLYEFINLASHEEDSWACELASRISGLVDEKVPLIQEYLIDEASQGVLYEYLKSGMSLTFGDLIKNPNNRETKLKVIPLLLERNEVSVLLPADNVRLKTNDKLLFCGTSEALSRMKWTMNHEQSLNYLHYGKDVGNSWLWNKLFGSSKSS